MNPKTLISFILLGIIFLVQIFDTNDRLLFVQIIALIGLVLLAVVKIVSDRKKL